MKKLTLSILLLFLAFNLFAQTETEYEIVRIEGFYTRGWEHSGFFEKCQDTIKGPMWSEFDENFNWSDSLKKIISETRLDGIFLKVAGRKKTNGDFGHLGAFTSMITITEIIFVDPKSTMTKYFENRSLQKE